MSKKQLTDTEDRIVETLKEIREKLLFMERVIFPVWEQEPLVRRFPRTLQLLAADLEESVINRLTGLLGDKGVFPEYLKLCDKEEPSKENERFWNLFLCDTEIFNEDLEKHRKLIAGLRRKHLQSSKDGAEILPPIKSGWQKVVKLTGRLSDMVDNRRMSDGGKDARITWPKDEGEWTDFISWCRLDDYEDHLKQAKRRRRRVKL